MTKRFSLPGRRCRGRTLMGADRPRQRDSLSGEPDDQVWGDTFPRAREVLMCQDQTGHLYRFIDPIPLPDVWRQGDDPRPGWVDWYRGWLDAD